MPSNALERRVCFNLRHVLMATALTTPINLTIIPLVPELAPSLRPYCSH
jgi:hypothetical protein